MALIPLNTFKTKTSVLTTMNYNRARCARDTALIIDSIAFDLLYGEDSQTSFAAIQYWAQDETRIPGEVFQTLAALEHAKQVALKLVVNTPVTATIGNTQAQIFGVNPSNSLGQSRVDAEFELIMNIIRNGTAGTTDNIVSNSMDAVGIAYSRAADILYSNRTFLQHEVVAYVNYKFGYDYNYDQAKCARDTKLIVDSLAFDLLYNGSTQSNFAGLQYWSQGSVSVDPAQVEETLAALQYIKTLVTKVVINDPIVNSDGNKLSQVINIAAAGSIESSVTTADLAQTIIDIFSAGTVGTSDLIVPNSDVSTDLGITNAYSLLQLNKKYIQTEVIQWIAASSASSTPPFVPSFTSQYNSDKCYRDVGFIIDCISFDLLHSGNRQSIQAGVYYYGFNSTVSSVDNEISETISAYEYLKTVVEYVVQAQPLEQYYQQDVDQVISNPGGNVTQAEISIRNISSITDIIQNGPSVAAEPTAIGLTRTRNPANILAANLLIDNKEFIAAEVIAYINETTRQRVVTAPQIEAGKVYTIVTLGDTDFTPFIDDPLVTPYEKLTFIAAVSGSPTSGTGTVSIGFTYPNNTIYDTTNLCFRDIGYIVDCMYFDLQHGGNRQATQAGVYYYSNSSTVSKVPTEKTDTINAFNYLGILISGVITNQEITPTFISAQKNKQKYLSAPYQSEVLQNLDWPTVSPDIGDLPLASSVYNTDNTGLIDSLVKIINLGPTTGIGTSNVAADRVPIPLILEPASADARLSAYNILMANKPYLISEVIAYMDSLKTPNTTKIYTAPPGVTAIILMAQVANVTNRYINITFSHYRNLPVYPDPATQNGFQAADTITEVVNNFVIPPNDSASLLTGKMIIESFDSIVAYASEAGGLKVTLSVLETANA